MNAPSKIWHKLGKKKEYREAFVASQLKRGIPAQIRVMLRQRGWTQEDLAQRSGLTQGAISRASDPDYGNLTFNNALRIAAGFDVAFVGRFVPFSELAKWYDEVSDQSLAVASFDNDDSTASGLGESVVSNKVAWNDGCAAYTYSPLSLVRYEGKLVTSLFPEHKELSYLITKSEFMTFPVSSTQQSEVPQ